MLIFFWLCMVQMQPWINELAHWRIGDYGYENLLLKFKDAYYANVT